MQNMQEILKWFKLLNPKQMKTIKVLVLSLVFIACGKEEIEAPIQTDSIKVKHLDKAAAQSVFMGDWYVTNEVTGTPTKLSIKHLDNDIYLFEAFNGTHKTVSETLIQTSDSTAVGANMNFVKYGLSLVKRGNYVNMVARVPFNNMTYFVNQTYRR